MKIKENKGITLIALVITIIVLLILAGVSIASLTGNNGLLSRSNEAKKETIKAEMKEKLGLELQEVQIEKLGKASLSDVTQDWIDNKIPEFENKIIANDASMKEIKVIMNKDGIIGKFIIDEKLRIIESEFPTDMSIDYTATAINGNMVTIEVSVISLESKIQKIEVIDENNTKIDETEGKGRDKIDANYQIEFGKKYTIIVTQEDGRDKKKEVCINEWYYTITKELGEGATLDNSAIKVNHGQKYEAIVTPTQQYVLKSLNVTMGGQSVTVEITREQGKISIENVTGDIEIVVTVDEKPKAPQITAAVESATSVKVVVTETNTGFTGVRYDYLINGTTSVANTADLSRTISGLTANVAYKIKVIASYDGIKVSSNEVTITIDFTEQLLEYPLLTSTGMKNVKRVDKSGKILEYRKNLSAGNCTNQYALPIEAWDDNIATSPKAGTYGFEVASEMIGKDLTWRQSPVSYRTSGFWFLDASMNELSEKFGWDYSGSKTIVEGTKYVKYYTNGHYLYEIPNDD